LREGADAQEHLEFVDPYVASQLEKAIVFWQQARRRMACGKSLNFANVGGELDILL
jgi:hypothetical protein